MALAMTPALAMALARAPALALAMAMALALVSEKKQGNKMTRDEYQKGKE